MTLDPALGPWGIGFRGHPPTRQSRHNKPRLFRDAQGFPRLWLWLDTSACYPGTYAALGTGDFHAPIPWGKLHACKACHLHDAEDKHGKPIKRWRFGKRGIASTRGVTYNISRPEKSLMLRAPLAKESGGLALCSKTVFQNKEDPRFQELLKAIQDAHQQLQVDKRFDMPGFRPNEHYIREMKRFGILPENLGPHDPIDVHAIDKAYWDSFYFEPDSQN